VRLRLRLRLGARVGLGLSVTLAERSFWRLRVIRMGAPWMRSLRRASRKLLQPASTYRERKAFVRKVGDKGDIGRCKEI